jgi:hypothetical protein
VGTGGGHKENISKSKLSFVVVCSDFNNGILSIGVKLHQSLPNRNKSDQFESKKILTIASKGSYLLILLH